MMLGYQGSYRRTAQFRALSTIAVMLSCVSSIATRVEAAPPARPQIALGGNNFNPGPTPHGPVLSTQDLASGLTPTDLVTALLGPGVSVSNVTFTGANVAAGTFSGGTGIVGFPSGIMLSSGSIAFVPGPNTQDSVSGVNAGIGDASVPSPES